MDAKKKPRDRRERFYCAYSDMLGARRKGDPGKRKREKKITTEAAEFRRGNGGAGGRARP